MSLHTAILLEAVAAAGEHDLSATSAHVLVAVAARSPRGECWASVACVAEDVRRGRSVVAEALADLERRGLIERRQRGQGQTATTRLLLPCLQPSGQPDGCQPKPSGPPDTKGSGRSDTKGSGPPDGEGRKRKETESEPARAQTLAVSASVPGAGTPSLEERRTEPDGRDEWDRLAGEVVMPQLLAAYHMLDDPKPGERRWEPQHARVAAILRKRRPDRTTVEWAAAEAKRIGYEAPVTRRHERDVCPSLEAVLRTVLDNAMRRQQRDAADEEPQEEAAA